MFVEPILPFLPLPFFFLLFPSIFSVTKQTSNQETNSLYNSKTQIMGLTQTTDLVHIMNLQPNVSMGV